MWWCCNSQSMDFINCLMSERVGTFFLIKYKLIYCFTSTTDVFVYNENFNLHYDDKYSIKNIIIHPEFSYEVNYKSMEVLYYRNDIALIEVNEAIYVEPIALGRIQVGAKVFSIAYSHDVPFPKEQQFYNLTTIRSAPGLCTDSDEYICTRIRSRKMYCFWHKGSLLIDRSRNGDKLIGIGSHFEDFCEVRYSGIFARVATYVFWIKNVTGVDFSI